MRLRTRKQMLDVLIAQARKSYAQNTILGLQIEMVDEGICPISGGTEDGLDD